MIKKSIFVLLAAFFLLCNAAIAHAQKIYLFAGGDIQDLNIGEAAKEDIKKFIGLFSYFESDKQVVYYNNSKSWTGPDIFYSDNVKEAILTAIRKCPATSSDKIVFYWSGHGAYNMNGHYLYMPKGSVPQVMFRSEIMNALKKKGASLTVLITDSCHVFHETPRIAFAPEPFMKYKGIPPLYRSLFFDCEGVVNINSSSCDEKSYCTPMGSIFTINFVDCLINNQGKYLDWGEFLDKVQIPVSKGRIYHMNLSDDDNKEFKQNIYLWGNLPPKPKLEPMPWKIVEYEIDSDDGRPFIPMFEPLYFPQNGDRILSVDGIEIQNAAHFNQVISEVDSTAVMFSLIDFRTGKTIERLVSELNPPGSTTRLGIIVQDDPQGGVRVTGVTPGTPGEKCVILRDKFLLDDGNEDSNQSADFYPVYGDRIIAVNDIKIRDEAHFGQVIRASHTQVRLTLIDHRTGKPVNIMTNLNPPGSKTRLGIYIQNDDLGGVMVTGVMPGTPGEKCHKINNDSVAPVDFNNK